MRHSIPVYFGNPKIDDYFNTNAFVWCKSENDLQRTFEEVKYLDSNDKAYIEMLMQSPLNDNNYVSEMYSKLEEFILNIFEQDPNDAFRRVRYYAAEQHEKLLKDYAKKYKNTPAIISKIPI